MKALLLAAGLGTRLRPLTLKVPKCLVPIAGKPLLEYHFDSLREAGFSDILINTHYLADQVSAFIDAYKIRNPDLSITISYEPQLLGSAGTLRNNFDFFKDQDDFLVSYADNFTNIDYKKLIAFHRDKKAICTIATYYEEHIEQKGMIILDDNNGILAFKEKPKTEEVVSHFANAGMYVMNSKIFDVINSFKKEQLLDFGHDVFPELLIRQEKMYAYTMNENLLDIGNMESYAMAQLLAAEMFK